MSFNSVDFLVLNNEDWRDTLTLKIGEDAVDLVGSSFVAQIRKAVEDLAVILEASTTNGKLIISEPTSAGLLSWNVAPQELRTIEPGTYFYDIVWTGQNGVVDTFVSGKITFERGVTRP